MMIVVNQLLVVAVAGQALEDKEWDVFQEDLVKVDLVKELVDVVLVAGFGSY
jgi:hypothetical protein